MSTSKVQLHPKLDHPHRQPQAADLSHARRVRHDRIVADPTDAVGLAELRRIERVEEFRAKLQATIFAQRFDGPVLVQREIERVRPRRKQYVGSRIPVVAQLRMRRDITLRSPEGGRVEVQLSRRIIDTAVLYAIGTGSGAG